MFEPLGLTSTDLAVYRVMLADPELDLPGVANELEASDADVTRSMENLEDKGFVRRSHASPEKFRAQPPQVAFERLLSEQEKELHRSQERLSAWRIEASRLTHELSRSSSTTSYGEFERLVEMDDVVGRLRQLARSVRVRVDSVLPSVPSRHALGQAKVDDGEMLDRGVAIRAIYPSEARQNDDALEFAQWFTERGGQVKTAIDLPPRFVIYDGDVALFRSDPPHGGHGSILINTPGAVMILQAYFDLLWHTGEYLIDPATEGECLRAEERELLRLLAHGYKDEAIARAMGISIRTLRRMVNALTSRTGAGSRFELGVQAVKRGWLD